SERHDPRDREAWRGRHHRPARDRPGRSGAGRQRHPGGHSAPSAPADARAAPPPALAAPAGAGRAGGDRAGRRRHRGLPLVVRQRPLREHRQRAGERLPGPGGGAASRAGGGRGVRRRGAGGSERGGRHAVRADLARHHRRRGAAGGVPRDGRRAHRRARAGLRHRGGALRQPRRHRPGRPDAADGGGPAQAVDQRQHRGDPDPLGAAGPAGGHPLRHPERGPPRPRGGGPAGERGDLQPAADAERLRQLHQGDPARPGEDPARPARSARDDRHLGRGQDSRRELMHGLDYKWRVLIVIAIGTFMVVLDTTIVNIALPRIITLFGSSVDQAQLVLTGYMLALAVIMPTTAFLSQMIGTKRLYVTTLALFTLGSMLCGAAWSVPSLVVSRVIQGLGGGMIQPLGMAMLFRVAPPHERGRLMGIYALPVMVAPIAGPTLGGYLVEYVDWRWVFYLNVPFGALGVLMGLLLLHETPTRRDVPFDIPGFLLAATCFSAALLGATDAPDYGWGDARVIWKLALSALALPLFIVW